jgi:hypothetical protein
MNPTESGTAVIPAFHHARLFSLTFREHLGSVALVCLNYIGTRGPRIFWEETQLMGGKVQESISRPVLKGKGVFLIMNLYSFY